MLRYTISLWGMILEDLKLINALIINYKGIYWFIDILQQQYPPYTGLVVQLLKLDNYLNICL